MFTKQECSVLHTVIVVLVGIIVFAYALSAGADYKSSKLENQVNSVQAQIKQARGKALQSDRVLAYKIVKVSNQYGINANIYTAILAHESMFKLNAVNERSHDYGIAQINIKNIRNMGLDLDLILTDLEYSLRAGAQVLSYMKKRYSASEANYACRYNVGTVAIMSRTQSIICSKYMSKIRKYYVAGME